MHAEILSYRTSTAVAGSLIPAALAAGFRPLRVAVYRMHDADWFGVYCESAWQIPVPQPGDSDAPYSPFLVPESGAAVGAGRESYGQPEKAGHVRLAADGDLLVGEVAGNGIDVAPATPCGKQRAALARSSASSCRALPPMSTCGCARRRKAS